MVIKVRAPAACGELAQGTIDGQNFLITCPIDWYAEAAVTAEVIAQDIWQTDKAKTRQAVVNTLRYLGEPDRSINLMVQSDIPSGKGLASSSADISAACQAVALSLGKSLNPDEIADIALAIEPTDGTFFPGIMLFDHVQGLLRRPLGTPPALPIAVFDVGGEVDTLCFNRRQDLIRLNQAKEQAVRSAVELIARGIAGQDAYLIGQGATISALANQSILYKSCLDIFVKTFPHYGAVGVNVAHSGTVIGVLFLPKTASNIPDFAAKLERTCPGIQYLRTVQLISGGLSIRGREP